MDTDAGQAGQPGQPSVQPALGGDAPGSEAGPGGNGGAGDQLAGAPGVDDDDAGGGGGAVGRIRINATDAPELGGTFSPALETEACTTGAIPIVRG